ncbi:MAG: rhodanese-like domain-containing protein [Steroidobacteraceae bacterium]
MERLLEYATRHPFLVSLAVAMMLAVLAFELRARRLSYAAVQPQEAIQLMNQGAQLYDLRDAAAYAAGHINGARHLDATQQGKAAEVLKKFRERLLILYCEDGVGSTALTRQLHAAGFTKVFNLRGGLAHWRAEGLPLARS